jgi:hypothetical protein
MTDARWIEHCRAGQVWQTTAFSVTTKVVMPPGRETVFIDEMDDIIMDEKTSTSVSSGKKSTKTTTTTTTSSSFHTSSTPTKHRNKRQRRT